MAPAHGTAYASLAAAIANISTGAIAICQFIDLKLIRSSANLQISYTLHDVLKEPHPNDFMEKPFLYRF
jgi:hypothetical protein